ncbi:hypothetical protein BJ986_002249 [Phycicoccus badiiscoriae]|uniref:Uncharacterized protein n=1 Tax=Pedococcus badiiscoriae TaxID=642776 RepID=A0A852WRC9_9MICO|nr:hypothetical protein [Pedococcus badiiscoriae]NYG07762.1 hypothetical protein [Pedococcus badiiscoriae]
MDIDGGAGPVPEPQFRLLWQGESVLAIVNMRTGSAHPIDQR